MANTLPTPEQDWQPTISADDERVADAVRGYVTALLWSSAYMQDDSGEIVQADAAYGTYDLSDFSADDQTAIVADVYDMMTGHPESERDFLTYCQKLSAEQFGHDFALTRNGHGAGFWDRGLDMLDSDLGDRLTRMSKPYGESHVDVSEDGVSLS